MRLISLPWLLTGWSHLSDWNPQLFREVKGRLKPRTALLTIGTSLAIQVLLVLFRLALLPGHKVSDTMSNSFCTGEPDPAHYDPLPLCLMDAVGQPLVNWPLWWSGLFEMMSWALPFMLLIAGVYLLIDDLSREERRGTLNFIRTSPQASQRILLGKMLGVPIVPYLAIGLAIPLHLWAAWGAKVDAFSVFSLYLIGAAACAFCFTAALLYALLGGFQPWLGAIIIWMSYTIFFSMWRSSYNPDPDYFLGLRQWYYLNIGHHLSLLLPFAIATLGVGTYWLWQAANRRYRNPNATLWSKPQSYWMTVGFEFWLLGFVFQTFKYPPNLPGVFSLYGLLNLVWFLGLMLALTPQRQTLLDWARYRHETGGQRRRSRKRAWLQEWLFQDDSPALAAIAVNLVIAALALTLWLLTWPSLEDQTIRLGLLGILAISLVQLLICAVVLQAILFSKAPRRLVWACVGLLAILVLPPALLGLFSVSPAQVPLAWLMTIASLAALDHLSLFNLGFSFLAQLSLFSLLTLRLTHRLRQAGESQSKALLAASPSR